MHAVPWKYMLPLSLCLYCNLYAPPPVCDEENKFYNIVFRTTAGDSLLHLTVMRNNTLKSQNLFEEGQYAFFPSLEVTQLLVECGAKINAMNAMANTVEIILAK